MKKCALAVSACLMGVAVAFAGDGRIEISQSMMPYTITNSGSYVVTENLLVTNFYADGITVQADNVVIDLNGFTLTGAGLFSGHAIWQPPAWNRLRIRNGMITDWANGGAYAIRAEGVNNQISHIVAQDIANGISSGPVSLIWQCNVYSNVTLGIGVTNYGIVAQSGSKIFDCIVHTVSGDGTAYAISGLDGSLVSDCTAVNNKNGIRVVASTVSECHTCSNSFVGIIVDNQCNVLRNTVNNNANSGIYIAGSGNQIEGNQAVGNGTGINLNSGSRNRIDGNYAAGNNIGITVLTSTNVVVRNMAGGNSTFNYFISGATSNAVGPITSDPTNSYPWANLQF